MKICPNCKQTYSDDKPLYCHKCGEALENIPDFNSQPLINNHHPRMANIVPDKTYPILWFIATLLVVIGIVVIVCGFFGSTIIYNTVNGSTKPSTYLPPDSLGYRLPGITSNPDALSISFGFGLLTTILGLGVIAQGEMLMLFINMQADTSVLRQNISRLVKVIAKNE